MVYSSIWKDTYYTVNDSTGQGLDPLEYYVTVTTGVSSETEIFRGKAYQKPGDNYIKIKVNKICQNYLYNDISDMFSSQDLILVNENASRIFKLYSTSGLLETYHFLYDWNYEISWTGGTMQLSYPAIPSYDPRMYKFKTLISGSVINYNHAGAYNKLSCGDYALYYLNSHGGFDSLLIEGNSKKKSTIKRNSVSTNYNNSSLEFEKRNYLNEITTSYELHTGWLSDEASAIIAKNLIPSIKVYLHDLNADKIYPVTITDTTAEYKTFKTNKVVTYTINVELSQSSIIR